MRFSAFTLSVFCLTSCANSNWSDPAYETGLYPRFSITQDSGGELLDCPKLESELDRRRAAKVLLEYNSAFYGQERAKNIEKHSISIFRKCRDHFVVIQAPDTASGGVGLVGVLLLDRETMQVLKTTIGGYPAIVEHLAQRRRLISRSP